MEGYVCRERGRCRRILHRFICVRYILNQGTMCTPTMVHISADLQGGSIDDKEDKSTSAESVRQPAGYNAIRWALYCSLLASCIGPWDPSSKIDLGSVSYYYSTTVVWCVRYMQPAYSCAAVVCFSAFNTAVRALYVLYIPGNNDCSTWSVIVLFVSNSNQ